MAISESQARVLFRRQRVGARHRGIEWQFTYEQWREWWGDDLERRGRGAKQLQMQRFGDIGPYHPHNVRKGTPADNMAVAAPRRVRANAISRRQAMMRAAMAAPSAASDIDTYERTDDEVELSRLGFNRKASWL